MALIDKGMDDEFKDNLYRASLVCYADRTDMIDEMGFQEAIDWLLEGAHKSDIGVIHRLIRNKLNE